MNDVPLQSIELISHVRLCTFTLLTYAPPAPHEEELENIPQRAGEAIHLGNNTIHDLIDWTTLPIYSGMSARPRIMYDHESNRILRPFSLHSLIERTRLHVPKWISCKRLRLLGIWGTEIDLNWPEEFLIQKWLKSKFPKLINKIQTAELIWEFANNYGMVGHLGYITWIMKLTFKSWIWIRSPYRVDSRIWTVMANPITPSQLLLLLLLLLQVMLLLLVWLQVFLWWDSACTNASGRLT